MEAAPKVVAKKPLRLEASPTLAEAAAKEWLKTNWEGVESYNELIAKFGVFSVGVRCF
jgi:hypothetical protein